jgi:hypothetical protein
LQRDAFWEFERAGRERAAPRYEVISIHIYGTDVSRIGSSVRRYYNQEVMSR